MTSSSFRGGLTSQGTMGGMIVTAIPVATHLEALEHPDRRVERQAVGQLSG